MSKSTFGKGGAKPFEKGGAKFQAFTPFLI